MKEGPLISQWQILDYFNHKYPNFWINEEHMPVQKILDLNLTDYYFGAAHEGDSLFMKN
jgi:hypothetical protein